MWLAAITALTLAHATPELTHVRRDPLTVRVTVDEVSARHGIVVSHVAEQFVRALREGGIRVRDAGTPTEPFPGGSITVAVDGFEEPGGETSRKVAFTIRVTVRQAVLLPDRTAAYADIWSVSLLGVSPSDALPETVRSGLEPVIQRLGDDLGAGHPEGPETPAVKPPPPANVLPL